VGAAPVPKWLHTYILGQLDDVLREEYCEPSISNMKVKVVGANAAVLV